MQKPFFADGKRSMVEANEGCVLSAAFHAGGWYEASAFTREKMAVKCMSRASGINEHRIVPGRLKSADPGAICMWTRVL